MYFKPTTYLISIKSPKHKIVNITAIFDALKVEWYWYLGETSIVLGIFVSNFEEPKKFPVQKFFTMDGESEYVCISI